MYSTATFLWPVKPRFPKCGETSVRCLPLGNRQGIVGHPGHCGPSYSWPASSAVHEWEAKNLVAFRAQGILKDDSALRWRWGMGLRSRHTFVILDQ